MIQTRRRFLGSAALAGVASMLPPLSARGAEPIPETVTIKLPRAPATCTMPQMLTQQLLQAEGFTDIRYVDGFARICRGWEAGTRPVRRRRLAASSTHRPRQIRGLGAEVAGLAGSVSS
jgi:hypothetical protein